MIARAHHLTDERLIDCYFADKQGEYVDPRVAEHLADCPACASRYASFTGPLDAVRNEADAEMASIFTPERLRAQQQAIAERVEHVGQSAHVLSFPTRVGTHIRSASRVAPRWVAAAAAAGLFVGMGAGLFFNSGARGPHVVETNIARSTPSAPAMLPSGMAPASRPSAPAASAPVEPPAATIAEIAQPDDEDAFLSELDIALERPRTHELLAFDEFTPHVRDVANRLR